MSTTTHKTAVHKEVMPDKPGSFILVTGSYGKAPEFEIVCGLVDCFKIIGQEHTEKEARGIIKKYLRMQNPHKFHITPEYRKGMFQVPSASFGHGSGDQTIKDEVRFVFRGRISPLYNASMTTEISRPLVQKFLTGLADALGDALGQIVVTVFYDGYQWNLRR
jgi:hypothetical protein